MDVGKKSRLHTPKIFISYSHADRKWFERFKKMMSPLLRGRAIVAWDDTKIKPGSMWKENILSELATADAALLLVSPDFLSSDFINNQELPRILDAAKDGNMTVYWALISSCLYECTEIVKYQATHSIKKPLDKLSRADRRTEISQICRLIGDNLPNQVSLLAA